MAIQIGNEESFEPAGAPQADGMMEELLSELLASAGPWLPGPDGGVQALPGEEPARPERFESLPSVPTQESPSAPSSALQPDAPLEAAQEMALEAVTEPVPLADPVVEPIPSGEYATSAGHNTERTSVEPEVSAPPLPESEPVAAQAPTFTPEPAPEPLVWGASESEPSPGSVLPTELVAAAPPSTGELDSLIASIDGEVAGGPRLTFETSLDSAAGITAENKKNCIVFSLEETRYAVAISNVIEMDKIPRITLVPNVPAFVRGVTNLRGEIVSVLDLRVLLGLSQSEQLDRGRILVVRAAGGQQTAALVVDEVRGIATVPLGRLKPPAGTIEDRVLPLLSGVCEYDDTLLNVLSLEKLFRSPEIHQLETS
jgi:purine-binding chemotaxis protein CheW